MWIRLLVPLLSLAIAACSGSSVAPDKPKPEPKDPYAVIYVENTTTPNAGVLATRYLLAANFEANDTRPGGSTAFEGAVGRGEAHCMSIAGFPVLQRLAIVAVADTSGITPPRSDAVLQAAALPGAVLFAGAVLRTTGVFDPLVSLADTTLGQTPQRPVKWRWTIGDAGTTLREDASVPCKHILDGSL